ncbi:MAG: response regulator [Alphaproteobacteria bacterium]|nr:response regulator [Alphaproteobacteria bacterium]MBU1515962.1 response regulator [Alphaproteobacteria bacterium]MBU2092823.1 response regulator [Alphaproteobacteria bacterium]MBU2153652.1 response regulator [Alphaproteobacteria bacterium]MBU2308280.1 response regulator [Alphaproteobacteria bacterium]
MTTLTGARGLPRSAVAVLLLFAAAAVVLAISGAEYPELHTILDTGVAVLSGILAMQLWDMGAHTKSDFARWLSVGFALTFSLDVIHVLVNIDWIGVLSPITTARGLLRPATWSPSAYLLPIGVAGALWRLSRGRGGIAGFVGATLVLAGLLFLIFQQVPAYLPPNPLGVTRPALFAVPLLWLAVSIWAWRLRGRHRLTLPIAWAGSALLIGHLAMLYSSAPADGQAMIAHVGKIAGYLVVVLWVMKMASEDMRDRASAEADLAALNAVLDQQVAERTGELMSAHENLDRESVERRRADEKALTQLARLSLLHQITRAIGDRQDLDSIYQVAVRSVEQQLPVDFACLCTYDADARRLTVTSVGTNSPELGLSLAAMTFEIDENHLTKCIQGSVLYEPDISAIASPFQAQLALTGLQSLVAAPLQIESKVFGCFIAARLKADAFVSADCEFLRQLSEHVALAAHQAQLYGALQTAYDDLRQSQQSVMQQERLRALGQMASGIAHDINNALSPVALYTEAMLETEKGLSPTARNQLEVIRRAVEDVGHTIGRMREFYRQREPQLPGAPVQLSELARHVLDLTRPRWADMSMQRGAVITVDTDFAQDLPLVLGAESEIREALTNLVFNAIDAMPDGGTLTLRTAPADEPGWVRIDVGDSGVGMDAEARRRCMEPFFTTKGERGTGLGLAMVYGVAQRHGAEVDVQSAPGEGTTFSLIFPAATRNAAKGEAEIEIPPPLRLLLVDDDPVLLKALSDALGNDGHLITPANDGQAGIDAFAEGQDGQPFDAVITDLGMPYVNGREVAAAVKAASPDTPVILLTGWGQGMLSGVEGIPNIDVVLSKPPKLREVRAALARHHRKAAE